MNEYKAYYIAYENRIVAGPFQSVEAAVDGKKKLTPNPALIVVKSTILCEEV